MFDKNDTIDDLVRIVKKNCDNCEFNFGNICTGINFNNSYDASYNKDVKKDCLNDCCEYGIDFITYAELLKK